LGNRECGVDETRAMAFEEEKEEGALAGAMNGFVAIHK
jgi:hypothetical protein